MSEKNKKRLIIKHFGRVLSDAGYTDVELLNKDKGWELWHGSYIGPARSTEERILYLLSNCSLGDVETAMAKIKYIVDEDDLTVIVRSPYNFSDDLTKVVDITGSDNVLSIRSFLYNVVNHAFGDLEFSLESGDVGLQYFIEPYIDMPSTQNDSEEAIHPLLDWLLGRSDSPVNLAVILAPAATGKSTLALEMFRRIATREGKDLLPLLVTREQWGTILQQEWVGLADIWGAAVSNLYAGAIVGPEQVERCLRYGTIVPIFDGLDELCTLLPHSFNVNDTLSEMIDLFYSDADSRILLTSRTRFWEENVLPGLKDEVLQIELLPFSSEQRDAYVEKRFPSEKEKQKRARKILQRIGGRTR